MNDDVQSDTSEEFNNDEDEAYSKGRNFSKTVGGKTTRDSDISANEGRNTDLYKSEYDG